MTLLTPGYRYISFDFETTGLDVQKDEPIQLGIVEYNTNCEIVRERSSLIKPKKDIKELKGIVTYLTGFNLIELEHAPTMEEILPEITSFFDESTIVIGHNIHFDVLILQKYLQWTPAGEIDTFPLSKSVCHFLPSYALDVVASHISSTNHENSLDDHHDALHDSRASLAVFKHRCEKMTTLRRGYMVLDSLLQRNSGIFQKIIRRTPKDFGYNNKTLFFPPLKKVSSTQKRIISAHKRKLSEEKVSRMYVGKQTPDQLIQGLELSHHKYVLAFTHKAKQQIFEQLLVKQGINYGNFYDAIIFNPESVNAFLQKEDISDAEFLFAIKYYSQYEAQHAQLDLNSQEDYMIFSALTEYSPSSSTRLIVCQHTQLREHASKLSEDYHVLLFDADRSQQSFGRRVQQPFNPYYLLQNIEKLLYKSQLLGKEQQVSHLKELEQQVLLSLGVMSSELDHLFAGQSAHKIEIEHLRYHTRLPKSAKTLQHVTKLIDSMADNFENDYRETIVTDNEKLKQCLDGPCQVKKQMYSGNKWYYVLAQSNIYRSLDEMIDTCGQGHIHLLSTTRSDRDAPEGLPVRTKHQATRLQKNVSIQTFIKRFDKKELQGTYILSASKDASRELFNECVKANLHQQYTFVAENITGGVGKNLYLAKQSNKPCIFIGGYAFFLQAIAKKFAFSDIYLYHIYGPKKQQIITDMLRYSSGQ